ncbi:MAG: hypothetical protein A2Y74_05300 [Actinobacteria bacterium RBG_13_63_9]|nr:MAG: hypothetical protein A2Y74_05300 [Actinobacteria bacterium RBG_13_63_9]
MLAEVTLPKDLVYGLLAPECQCRAICCGEPLHQEWGDECESGRVISRVFRAATLSVAEGEARIWHVAGQETLNHILDLRAVRLLRRAATIEGAHMVCGEVLPEVTP